MWWPAVVKSEWELSSHSDLTTAGHRWNNKFYYKVAFCWLFLLSVFLLSFPRVPQFYRIGSLHSPVCTVTATMHRKTTEETHFTKEYGHKTNVTKYSRMSNITTFVCILLTLLTVGNVHMYQQDFVEWSRQLWYNSRRLLFWRWM